MVISTPRLPPRRLPQLFSVGAESFIDAFERIHGLAVTLQDHAGNLRPFLKPGRVQAPRPSSLNVSIFHNDKLCWVISAGPRLAKGQPALRPGRIGAASSAADQAANIIEHLRQLSARLQLWLEAANPTQINESSANDSEGPPSESARQSVILRFIEANYAQPVTLAMLARKLRLSEGRGSHVVRQCCRESFRDLLLQKRLRVAMELLRQSGLSVSEVASASGFVSVAHFHRLFRRRVGRTPAQYRTDG